MNPQTQKTSGNNHQEKVLGTWIVYKVYKQYTQHTNNIKEELNDLDIKKEWNDEYVEKKERY